MAVLTLAGRPINWFKPPKATTKVLWSQRTSGGKQVIGSLRTIAHLDHLNTLAKKKFGTGIVVIQAPYNTGVSASAGTHDYDACVDLTIPGVSWTTQNAFFRANGHGGWVRTPPAFGYHWHGFTLPPISGGSQVSKRWWNLGFKVGKYVDGGWSLYGRSVGSSQIEDYYNSRNGLKGHARDYAWRPQVIDATVFNLDLYIRRQQALDPSYIKIRAAHMSTQFNDSGAQKAADAEKVFKRGYDLITGTEAYEQNGRAALQKAATKYGYFFFDPPHQGGWVAVKKAVGTNFTTRYVKVLSGKIGEFSDRGTVSVSFRLTKAKRRCKVTAVHYVTHGKPYGDASDKKYLGLNRKYAHQIGVENDQVTDRRDGTVCFGGADFNIDDQRADVFLSRSMRSQTCWDKLGKYPNTVPGATIDALWNQKDQGTTLIGARVITDADLPLATDHWLVEAEYRVPVKK